jgi:lipoprotein-anchoring transpeptidase ErfK/SrfK
MNLKIFATSMLLSGIVALTGCTTSSVSFLPSSTYGAVSDGGFRLPAIPTGKVNEKFRRQTVTYVTKEKVGTIIVDTSARQLYFVLGGGKAVRYGIGVGRDGFRWSGTARIGAKRVWPTWTPPKEMIARKPELIKFADGQGPGLTNPLGPRALYLYNKSGDTGFRLHGTPEWWSIGKAVSSGCIRLLNQDIIDLYERAKEGAKVIVK